MDVATGMYNHRSDNGGELPVCGKESMQCRNLLSLYDITSDSGFG